MKNKNIILVIIILIVVGGGWFIKSRNSNLEKKEMVSEKTEEKVETSSDESLTPEEVLERLSEESEVERDDSSNC